MLSMKVALQLNYTRPGSDTDAARTFTINVIVEGDGINEQLDYDTENETHPNDTASEDNDSYNSPSPRYYGRN